MAQNKKKHVLFVCMGNICRSPAGEGLFRAFVAQRGLADRFEIDSAGTIGHHTGEPPDSRMRRAAAARGYDLTGSARQFAAEDFERFDMIVAMDRSNLQGIRALDPGGRYRHKTCLMLDNHPAPRTLDVPDPYYGGPKGFEEVLDLIEQSCEGLLTRLQEQQP